VLEGDKNHLGSPRRRRHQQVRKHR
jgi:hypothetical protein